MKKVPNLKGNRLVFYNLKGNKRPRAAGKEKPMRSLIMDLKNFNSDGKDLDELVELAAEGRAFRAEYEALQLEVPEWLDNSLKAVRRDIRDRVADSKAARLKELKARRAQLKTTEEKRSVLDKEIEKLEAVAAE